MKIPKHIAFILDGNRRFAKKNKLLLMKGHNYGYETVKKLIEWCLEFKIKELTLYVFSTENFQRSKKEVNYIMGLFKKALNELENHKKFNKIKIKIIGEKSLFPKEVQKSMDSITKNSKSHKTLKLNLAMGYSGRLEIIEAAKKIGKKLIENKMKISQINEKSFKKELYLKSEPNLIIRTSESRLSGFLTFQSVYSEIIFMLDKLWPEFTKEDFIWCLNEYTKRIRRYGK